MCEPNFFFLTQVLTMGESDLRDFSVIYMDNFEAFIYSWICVFDMLFWYPFSVAWVIFVGPIYFLQWLINIIRFWAGKDDGSRKDKRNMRNN